MADLYRCTECEEVLPLNTPHHCWDKCIGGAELVCGHRWLEDPQPGEEPNAGPKFPTHVVRICTLPKNHWPNPVDHHDQRVTYADS